LFEISYNANRRRFLARQIMDHVAQPKGRKSFSIDTIRFARAALQTLSNNVLVTS
jgi:hypothetical protein